MADPPTYAELAGKAREEKVDVLVSAGPAGQEPVHCSDGLAYDRLLAEVSDRERSRITSNAGGLPSGEHGPVLERFELTLPANQFVDFGFRLAIEPISCDPWRFTRGSGRIPQGRPDHQGRRQDDFDPHAAAEVVL